MSIRVAIEHRTAYRYDRAVELGPQLVRLRPAPHCRTPILAYSLTVTPAEHFINWQQDPFGNHVARLVFTKPSDELTLTVDLIADMTVINPFDFFVDESAELWPFEYEDSLARDLAPYLVSDGGGPALQAFVAGVDREPRRVIDFLVELNRGVRDRVAYSVRMEPGVQEPDQTLERGVGSCRDSGWLLVEALRALGVAARFVSGYLVQLTPDELPADGGPAGPQADFTDLHAWAEAYIPGAGWVGLDATSGLLAGEGHIPLACSPFPAEAAPLTGVTGTAGVEFDHSNSVRRVHETARVTLPYRESQWRAIEALGRTVDRALEQGDVRLTMGGEPTFVASDDTEAPEWNTEALGGEKRPLATALASRLADEFAPGALLMHTQGKWYPGEPLPRWQIAVLWRTDGHPLWTDRALLADPTEPGTYSKADAEAVAASIGATLGLGGTELWYRAYEDPVGRLWDEARLPGGEPPQRDGPEPNGGLSDADARVAVVEALDADRGEPAGLVLPLHRSPGDEEWATGQWTLRRGHLFLIAGDSPIGLRLPLASLTWTPRPADAEQSLFRDVPRLPRSGPGEAAAPVLMVDPPPVTALCIELRDGHVYVFLPPLVEFAHAAELIGAVEAAAAEAGVALVVEGYGPPADTRCGRFVVAPDPGVIEVNIHPSRSWPELSARTMAIDREARALGLATEKFALDGTHTGTGGGSHITIGGPTPADSPLLRRPDLLRSMVIYWQHHPALSYLFAGRFIGPTSQAPRVDEARHETLYELEVAFAELDRLSGRGPARPWQVDRLFRNLLVDLTGNTHRAEFCIDKLFSPDSEHGRLGVLELRSFEMPPHPQMALVQALLVRALVARLWADPYSRALVRWGTELHDSFMLPWFLERDLASVLDDLARRGMKFDRAWFEPFLEFRFPVLGSVTIGDVSLELRAAIEPWHVLGEEASAGGTARYVDSSLERLQVRVDGLTEPRYAVTCNGHMVPLQPTDTPGTRVAGVRYRAWQPPSALHPTIGVHAPLTFDVIDLWNSRSLGGCRYHVTHPGGVAYERMPVNAAEAEARRTSRFEPLHHSAGTVQPADVRRTGEYPRTLDLRLLGSG
jgi:uncharacterized protein (DUF2126 family)/transglutaminase-like putative cysteine protease